MPVAPPPPTNFVASPQSATPPVPVPQSDDGSVVQRPLTEVETGMLKRSAKNGAPGMLRFFGAFVGIMPLFLIGMAMMGTPFVPENYIAIVLVTGFLGVALAGASQGVRTPLVRAAKAGTAYEVYGVPEIQAAPGNQSLVGLGGLTFRMKAAQAARLLPDRINRVTFADGGATAGTRRRYGSNVAFVLESNGAVGTRAENCYLVGSAAVDGATVLGSKMVRGL